MADQMLNRAAILARCSSETNVCDQILALKQYAKDRYIIDEDDVYGDNIGGSSKLSERIELQRLIDNIAKGNKQYSVVLVKDVTRLGKSAEQVQEIQNWFSERNIPLCFQER